MTTDLFKDYMDEIIKKRPGALFSPPSLLVMDKAASHSKDMVESVSNMSGAVIPGGCTSLVQPLDVSINKPFKCAMRKQWKDWMNAPSEDHELTNAGKRKRVRHGQNNAIFNYWVTF